MAWIRRQIVTLPVDGRSRRVVLTAGKEAIYDALDLDNGGRTIRGTRRRCF